MIDHGCDEQKYIFLTWDILTINSGLEEVHFEKNSNIYNLWVVEKCVNSIADEKNLTNKKKN